MGGTRQECIFLVGGCARREHGLVGSRPMRGAFFGIVPSYECEPFSLNLRPVFLSLYGRGVLKRRQNEGNDPHMYPNKGIKIDLVPKTTLNLEKCGPV